MPPVSNHLPIPVPSPAPYWCSLHLAQALITFSGPHLCVEVRSSCPGSDSHDKLPFYWEPLLTCLGWQPRMDATFLRFTSWMPSSHPSPWTPTPFLGYPHMDTLLTLLGRWLPTSAFPLLVWMPRYSALALTPHARSLVSMDAYLALPYLTASGLNCSGRGRSKTAFKNLYIVTEIFFLRSNNS